MDEQVVALGAQLAALSARSSAAMIADRIQASKAKREQSTTISELEEIITGLIRDKYEAIQIAQAFEHEVAAKRLTDSDISYITSTLGPLIERFASLASAGEEDGKIHDGVAIMKDFLSKETFTVLQAIGFDFQGAIGKPLTSMVRDSILRLSHHEPDMSNSNLQVQQQIELFRVAQHPDATARLQLLLGNES